MASSEVSGTLPWSDEIERERAYRTAYRQRNRRLYADAAKRALAKMQVERPDEWREKLNRNAERAREWRKTANGKRRAHANQQRRRARKAGAAVALTAQDWENICRAHSGHDGVRCAYCGRRCTPTVDHVVPLSRGGQHTASNVVPACRRCNNSKGARLVTEWAGGAAFVARCAPLEVKS